MRVNEIAAYAHKRMCNDDRFGYSWEERHGAVREVWKIDGKDYSISVGDYDCSSSTIDAWRLALQHTKYRGALDAAINTRNMRAVFVASGLFEWKPMSFLAEPGDLYLNEANHVAMCQTQVPDVLSEFSWGDNGAYGNKRGDQSGHEASVHGYYDYKPGGWDGILHYNGKADGTSAKETKRTQATTKKQAKSFLNGIDIASHQAGIDVARVDADFVIVKVSGGSPSGKPYVNPHWKEWANRVLKAGKLLGLYHYAVEYGVPSSGKAEAEFFLKQVKGFEGKAVLCLDWEADAQNQPVSYAKAWLDTVAKATGSTPFFYGYASYINSRSHNIISKYPLWMASYLNRYEWGSGYVENPDNTWDTGSWGGMTMYQYASTRYIGGWDGRLDVNVFYGTREDWLKLAGAESAAKVETEVEAKPADATIHKLAIAVIQGKYGTGETRKDKLGKNYAAVQEEVNRILEADDTESLAIRVLGGEFGSGEERKRKLGSKYEAVQAKVNELLGVTKKVTGHTGDGLAKAAARLAYSKPAQHDPETGANPGTKAYQKGYGGTWRKKDTKASAPRVYNVQGRSCDRSVSVAVLVSGYDDSMHRTTGGIYEHLMASERWQDRGKWDGKETSLEPGDILIRLKDWDGSKGNHVCMYVGNAIAKEVYAKHLKGTDADKGAPASDTRWYSGHLAGGNPPDKGYAPCLGNAKYAHADKAMRVFRCVKPQKSDTFAKLV